MKQMKKLLTRLLWTLALCLIMAIPAMAETTSVKETYSFSKVDQTKTLTYTMPQSGYVYFTLNPTECRGKNKKYGSLAYEISADGVVYETAKVLKPDGKKTTLKYAFPKGTKIKLKMTSTYYLNDYISKVTVVAHEKVLTNFEKEGNDSKAKANTLKLDTYAKGLTMLKNNDWFVFKAPKAGEYKVTGNVYEDSNRSVEFEVFKETAKGVNKRLAYSAFAKSGETKDMSKGYVSLAKGDMLYINVKGLTKAKGFHNLYRFKVIAK